MYCEVDLFGLFALKDNRKEIKTYGSLCQVGP